MIKPTAKPNALMSLNNIGVEFNDTAVLNHISLDINHGQITTIIGPNGAGKSTLVKVIVGLLKPTNGSLLKGKGRSGKLKIGYMPQTLHVDTLLPIKVSRFLSLVGKQKPSTKDRNHALALVGMHNANDKPLHVLSGGEFQRVLLARAILQQPDLLVLDEPLQGVDLNGQVALYELIGTLREQLNCAIVMVSHDLHLVMAQTDNVVCLNGHICCHGKPQSVSQHPEYLRLFGQKGLENVAVYTHDHDHHHTVEGGVVSCSNECDHS